MEQNLCLVIINASIALIIFNKLLSVSSCGEEGDVRLVPVGNVNGSGRVEMCLDREWRIVGDETWGVEEATVVCRQLGLPTDGQDYNYDDKCTG